MCLEKKEVVQTLAGFFMPTNLKSGTISIDNPKNINN